MTISEIFAAISSHMIKGMMVHEQLKNSYLLLGLTGYAACHEYHYLSETITHSDLNKYYMEHYSKLIEPLKVEDPGVIPVSWYDVTRDEISFEVRKQAIEAALRTWINWEEQTRTLYSEMYKELLSMSELSAAELVKKYAIDAEEELVYAKNDLVEKTAMDFDIVSIIEEQNRYRKVFNKKKSSILEDK